MRRSLPFGEGDIRCVVGVADRDADVPTLCVTVPAVGLLVRVPSRACGSLTPCLGLIFFCHFDRDDGRFCVTRLLGAIGGQIYMLDRVISMCLCMHGEDGLTS